MLSPERKKVEIKKKRMYYYIERDREKIDDVFLISWNLLYVSELTMIYNYGYLKYNGDDNGRVRRTTFLDLMENIYPMMNTYQNRVLDFLKKEKRKGRYDLYRKRIERYLKVLKYYECENSLKNLSMKHTPNKGLCIYANFGIRKGVTVSLLSGVGHVDKSKRKIGNKSLEELEKKGIVYSIGKDWEKEVVDGWDESVTNFVFRHTHHGYFLEMGNIARYFSNSHKYIDSEGNVHSPNLELIHDEDGYISRFVATRNIQVNEELSYEYNRPTEELCLCKNVPFFHLISFKNSIMKNKKKLKDHQFKAFSLYSEMCFGEKESDMTTLYKS